MGTRIATATLESVSPYSQSKHFVIEKRTAQETHDAAERRLWRNRMHRNDDGCVFIPPMSFKLCLENAAQFRGDKVKGKGNATFTKHFKSGVMVVEPLQLSLKVDDVPGEELFVPSDGKRGGGSRVTKVFPLISGWGGKVNFIVLDETIDEDTFAATLADAGRFIGIGRFRPQNGGFYGRFAVKGIDWERET